LVGIVDLPVSWHSSMVKKSQRIAKLFAQKEHLPWPASATSLMACVLFPCAVALRALQACIVSGAISMRLVPLPPVTFPWMAWPLLMMGALWQRYTDGAWFRSAAVTGRAVAAAALLGILEAGAASFDFFVPLTFSSQRQAVLFAALRSADIPVAAALSAALTTDSQPRHPSSALAAVLLSMPISVGLTVASLLVNNHEIRPGPPQVPAHDGDALLVAAAAAATLCRAFRCACGSLLLRQVGVENSLGGLFFVGGFSGFFGSMLVLPMTLGHFPLKFASESWTSIPRALQLDFSVLAIATLCLGAADTLSRLAILRHSDTVTAAALDAGILPLAALIARTTGMASPDLLDKDLRLPEFLALMTLLLSFFLQLRSASSRHVLAHSSDAAGHPVLLGRASLDNMQGDVLAGQRKFRQV